MTSERKHLILKLTLWSLLWLLSEVTLDLIGFPTLTQVVSRNLPFTAEEPPEKGKGIWNVMLAFPAISLEA